MDDLFNYIFIAFLIISFFSGLFGKDKKKNEPVEYEPTDDNSKTDGQDILEEIFGVKTEEPEIPKEDPKPEPVLRSRTQRVEKRPLPSPDVQSVNKYAKYNEFVAPSKDTLQGELDAVKNFGYIAKTSSKTKKQKEILAILKNKKKFRNAIIVKEILDKPLAMRN